MCRIFCAAFADYSISLQTQYREHLLYSLKTIDSGVYNEALSIPLSRETRKGRVSEKQSSSEIGRDPAGRVWRSKIRTRPLCDLWLSPGHNIASYGALMPISALINGVSVAQIEQDFVEYWHVELDAHDILLAEGLPAESYLDCGNRTGFVNGGAFIEAHPDFRPKHWAATCLPLIQQGPPVAMAKARLNARLADEGYRVDHEADVHIVVNGVRVEPTRLSEMRLAFMLPAGGCKITLRSNVFTPAHTVAESTDPRELGICVGHLQIDGSTVALGCDETCASGWHEAEFADGDFSHRWTTGETPLPTGTRIVIIDLAGDGHYWRRHMDRFVALSAWSASNNQSINPSRRLQYLQ
jgi:hypothetical protein